ncbi:MAG: FtsX-like permease family protein, partial [Clostridia bacterium]|nr:FtsX-like permease family protein [Clostridia bacterium]
MKQKFLSANLNGKEEVMKNPLNKRIFREIKSEAGKYLVIFLLMTAIIGIVSGYLIGDESLKTAYDESFKKYNVEDGNFELMTKADKSLISSIEDEKVKIYENFYIEEKTEKISSTVRFFKNRKQVNKVCLWDGELPKYETEVAIDRLYAKNNKLEIGDTLRIKNKSLKITGIVALSDYSALYRNNTDFMFDCVKFGVAIVTEDGFESLPQNHLHYSYSWKYNNPPADPLGKKAIDMGNDFMNSLSKKAVITNFIPRCSSNAINFAGEDMGGDRVMFITFLYLLIIIISFVFAVTTSNTIRKEANVIGTLRASGYKKSELICHYMAPSAIVLLVAAVVGNVLGYTVLEKYMSSAFLNSYSLTTYKTLINATAFIDTTVIPLIILLLINFIMLARVLSLSPLKFLRRDLKRHQRKKAFRLNTKIHILIRYRLRVFFQNIPNYITIFAGIFFASIIMVFGIMYSPLLENFEEKTVDSMLAPYQYVLKVPAETKTKDAEKYSIYELKTTGRDFVEEISVLGIHKNSKYFKTDIKDDGIIISSAYADKYSLKIGDRITLKESYEDKKYTFKINGIYEYPSTLAVFIDIDNFNKTFDFDKDYFTGYFSKEKIKDIDESIIASQITKDDLTKTSRQLENS